MLTNEIKKKNSLLGIKFLINGTKYENEINQMLNTVYL